MSERHNAGLQVRDADETATAISGGGVNPGRATPAATSEPPDPPRTLTYPETLRELAKTRRLYESGRIGIRQWCESVHRIIAAFEQGRRG